MIKLPRTADYFLTVSAFEVVALQRYLELMERNLAALIASFDRIGPISIVGASLMLLGLGAVVFTNIADRWRGTMRTDEERES